jgi:hypothetical protein
MDANIVTKIVLTRRVGTHRLLSVMKLTVANNLQNAGSQESEQSVDLARASVLELLLLLLVPVVLIISTGSGVLIG